MAVDLLTALYILYQFSFLKNCEKKTHRSPLELDTAEYDIKMLSINNDLCHAVCVTGRPPRFALTQYSIIRMMSFASNFNNKN